MKRFVTLFLIAASLGLGVALFSPRVSAVDVLSPACNGNDAASAACRDNNPDASNPSTNPLFGSNGVITIVIRILGLIIGFIAVVMIIASGLKMIMAGGDAAAVKEARASLGHALGALLVALLAESIVEFILDKIP